MSRALSMASPEGFEPPTCGLEIRCSIHLSYGLELAESQYLA